MAADPQTTDRLPPNPDLCDAGLWVVAAGETCPICGAGPRGEFCKRAEDEAEAGNEAG